MTRWTWSVIATAAATLLSATASLPASAQPAAAGDPLAGAPAVGECRTYTAADRMSYHEDSPAVDCAGPHTALVVKVEIAPSKYDLSGKPNAQLYAYVSETCGPAWKRAVGTTHAQGHLVAYTYSWYTPTKYQLSLGARWIRCDVNAYDGKDGLGDLPQSTPFVDGNIDQVDRKCLDGTGYITSCANPHKWISRGLITVPKGPYSKDRQDAAARSRCQSTLKRSDRRYLWIRISESAWKRGERHIVCFGNGG